MVVLVTPDDMSIRSLGPTYSERWRAGAQGGCPCLLAPRWGFATRLRRNPGPMRAGGLGTKTPSFLLAGPAAHRDFGRHRRPSSGFSGTSSALVVGEARKGRQAAWGRRCLRHVASGAISFIQTRRAAGPENPVGDSARPLPKDSLSVREHRTALMNKSLLK